MTDGLLFFGLNIFNLIVKTANKGFIKSGFKMVELQLNYRTYLLSLQYRYKNCGKFRV